MSTLQTGTAQISAQEFDKYNNKKVSGTEVNSAISLYSGRDLALVVRTSSCANMSIHNGTDGDTDTGNNMDHIPWAYNYGALLSNDASFANSNTKQEFSNINGEDIVVYGLWDDPNAHTAGNEAIRNLSGSTSALTSTKNDVWRMTGAANYTSYYAEENGKIQCNYDLAGTTKVSSPEYIIASGSFQCTLIKTPGGTIIGILFEQQ